MSDLQRAMRRFQAAKSGERLHPATKDDGVIVLRRRNMATESKSRRELLIELSLKIQLPQEREKIERIRKDHQLGDLKPTDYPSIELICQVVQTYFRLKKVEFESRRHTQRVVRPRQIAMYLSRVMTTRSYPYIGIVVGGGNGFDHTTVMHGIDKIEAELPVDGDLRDQIKQLKLLIIAEFTKEKRSAEQTDSQGAPDEMVQA